MDLVARPHLIATVSPPIAPSTIITPGHAEPEADNSVSASGDSRTPPIYHTKNEHCKSLRIKKRAKSKHSNKRALSVISEESEDFAPGVVKNRIVVGLVNEELWKKLNIIGNEMRITIRGR